MTLEKSEAEPKPDPNGMFHKELKNLINRFSIENKSNTPDFILATYIETCLKAYENATRHRDQWYGINHAPGGQR